MKKAIQCVLFFAAVSCSLVSAFGAGTDSNAENTVTISKEKVFKPQPYSTQSDIAFVSVWGSKPDVKKLQGFQRAVLFNARGEVVTKVDMRSDSVYSLDKMIQENKTKGPLLIRMYR